MIVRTCDSGWRGITLIEVLVVLALVFILTGLLLPAVQSTREAARRLQCSQNLRQIGVALHHYQGSIGSLPPGNLPCYDPRYSTGDCHVVWLDKGMFALLLPYLEQTTLFNAINQDLSIFARENSTVDATAIATLVCPSDSAAATPTELPDIHSLGPMFERPADLARRMALTSYAGSYGSYPVTANARPGQSCLIPSQVLDQLDGMFNSRRDLTLADVSDGLSQTMFVAEHSITTIRRAQEAVSLAPDESGWLVSGAPESTQFLTYYPPNSHRRVNLSGAIHFNRAASSNHPGGINVLMGDGSVRFVADTISSWPFDESTGTPIGAVQNPQGWIQVAAQPGVWQALGTRSKHEVLGEF